MPSKVVHGLGISWWVLLLGLPSLVISAEPNLASISVAVLDDESKPIGVISPALARWSDDSVDAPLSIAFRRVAAIMNPSPLLLFEPQNRAFHDFLQKKQKCLLGGDPIIFKKLFGIEMVGSERFLPMKLVVFNLPPHPIITSREQMRSLRVGANGIAKERFLQVFNVAPKSLDVADNVNQNVEKLKLGRIDAFAMAWPKSFTLTQGLQFDPEFALDSWDEALICYPSEEANAFIKQFNEALFIARAKGVIPQDNAQAWIRWQPEYSEPVFSNP